ncbi:unnamed protein product [Alopecurus aequalis]
MLRLRSCIFARILSSPAAYPISHLHRLLSEDAAAAEPAASPTPAFAVQEYLVGTCGLTPAQALKASTKLTHLKSPSNPDAVLAFLAGLGLSTADVAALVAKDPERVVKPNVAFPRECGLGACDNVKLCFRLPRLLNAKQEGHRAMVACAEGFGVPRGSGMFRFTLQGVGFRSEQNIAARVDNLKKTFRWSDAEVGIAVSKNPAVMSTSKETLQHKSEFLIDEVGLELAYIARRPVIINYSLQGWLRPRCYVVMFLKKNGLLHQDRDYYSALMIGEKVFLEKFVCPHKEAAPHLAEDYAAACSGEIPTRFRFT